MWRVRFGSEERKETTRCNGDDEAILHKSFAVGGYTSDQGWPGRPMSTVACSN